MPINVLTSAKNHATKASLIFSWLVYNICLLPTKFQRKETIFGVLSPVFPPNHPKWWYISLSVRMELKEETVKKGEENPSLTLQRHIKCVYPLC